MQRDDFRAVVEDDVGVGRVPPREILMIRLGRIEATAFDPRRDGRLVNVRGVQPRDEGPGEALLARRLGKDGRAVAWPDIGALAVHLRWVVRDGEVDLQQLRVVDLRRVVRDPDYFGVPGAFGAD